MSSGASSSSSPPPAESGDGYWEAREEAAARLEAMAARARGEDELSAEQLETNNRLQEDEVLALQAIYGDDMVILEDKACLRSFQLFVRYPIPNGTKVFLNLHPNGTMVGTDNDGSQDGSELFYACSLKHLPPVVLTCLLPCSYPSTSAPYFTISAKWLDEPKVSHLCAMLDEIWTDLPGQEVVYRWLDWLNSSSWPCISLNDNIILVPDKTSDVGDERAIARRLLVDSTIPLMQSYNERRSHEIFLKSFHECGICLSENTGRNFIKLPCHHLFCLTCMKSHCRIHVTEGNLTQLTCPDTTCRSPLPPSVLKILLGDDCYKRWESFTLQKLLDTMPDLVYCPRCDAACLEVDNDAQCPECFFTFCSLCKERRHVGEHCVTPEEKIRILREKHQKYSLPEKQLLREQREIDELVNVCEALRDSKQCPRCKMAISKTEGCNKMTCRNCGKFFCYRCNQAIHGYEHFWDGNCVLFEHHNQVGRRYGLFEELDDDEGSDDEDLEEPEPEPEPEMVWGHPCPMCGRRNEKVVSGSAFSL
ncbi:E3 ubiquitin-protein ligase RNF14-like isoform X2 [Sorghum bicolor]|uniref:E3 ubiquitin-protein ligase RNF14-like isoform X2 n=1 Tax=Sorghum bicolor TaxID=4558 RepID=UPI000B426521|nr:E3 ubiquitin-protein ligase RNF14-like isoform X2 [Sorghum bicolor]|eukprot:XP_021316090.1 E3 ubiquitin-protein ligase RNF14-like isoform X2 [Sorghum bicolor]